MYWQMMKMGLFFLLVLISRVEGEAFEAIVDGVKFKLCAYKDVLDDDSCEERTYVGFNNVGQALFYEGDHLILWDSHQETSTDLSKLIDQNPFIYCPEGGQCLNDEGEIVGLVDLNLVKWSREAGLSLYPLPEELCKEDWECFHVLDIKYLDEGRVLLKFGGAYTSPRYYIFDNGEYSNLSAYLKTYVLGQSASYSIDDLHINKQGMIAGILRYSSYSEPVKIFMWDGSFVQFLNMQDIMRKKNHASQCLKILLFLENGDVRIYFEDFKSIHKNYYNYRYVLWHPENGQVDSLMDEKENSLNSFNSKGNGVFVRDSAYHLIHRGVIYNLGDLFCDLRLNPSRWPRSFLADYHLDDFLKINENNEIFIGETYECNIPAILSISPI